MRPLDRISSSPWRIRAQALSTAAAHCRIGGSSAPRLRGSPPRVCHWVRRHRPFHHHSSAARSINNTDSPSSSRENSNPQQPWRRFLPSGRLALWAAIALALYLTTDVVMMENASAGSDKICYATHAEMVEAAREIRDALVAQAKKEGGEGERQVVVDLDPEDLVTFDEDVVEAHGHSDWSTSNTARRPVAVVYPTSTQQVVLVARICTKWGVPMVPYGAGSSVEGNFSSPFSGICVDFTRMDKVVAFHPDDMDVVVQPGVNWVDLNKMTSTTSRLFLPLDPSPTATVGGMISTNCSGTNAFRYGTMKDWVLSVTVVLADGTVVRTRRRPRKTSAGYNLTSLFVGAEGTLGFVTEATLKLAVVPDAQGVAVVSFPGGVHDAATAAARLIRSGIQLGALEIMDDVQMKVLNEHGSEGVRRHNWDEAATLFLKFAGTEASVQGDLARTREVIKQLKPGKFFIAKDQNEQDELWSARKEALWTMTSIKPPGYNLWSTDVAVPISKLADIITLSKEDASQLGLFNSVIGHVGDGNFHQSVMYDPKNKEQRDRVAACVHRMMDRALSMEGTVSGEHAIGIGKKECLLDELGEDTIGLMRTLKQAVDPKWIMNPGKVFDHPDQPSSE